MAITPLPPAPLPTDSTAEFNSKAFALVAALDPFVTETNATAVQVDADKTTATSAASTATTGANTATTQAGIATTQAGIATNAASEAAGLVENYQGALASDPALNKDGDPLTAGDWYVNTSTGLIRAYTGSVWVTSVNVTAGVTSFSAGTTGLTPSTGTEGAVTLAGTLAAANGGTGATSLAANNVLLGNGTSALQVVAPGTTGNVLTSNGTTWASSAPAPSAGTVTAVATGTIANGATVIFNSDGTVSTVSGANETAYSPTVFSTSTIINGRSQAVYDSGSNKVIVVYRNQSSTNRGTVVVGTVSGTTISFGSPVNFTTYDCTTTAMCYDVSQNKILVAYRSSDAYSKVRVGTISGTSVTFGTEVTVSTANPTSNDINLIYHPVAQKVVMTNFNQDTGNTDVRVGTISGTSISFGTAVTLKSTGMTYVSTCYDSVNQKIVFTYSTNGIGTFARVGTVSGTSISFGTELNILGSVNFASYLSCAYDANAQKVLLAYAAPTTNFGTARIGTVSGTSISFGSDYTFENAVTQWMSITYMQSDNKCLIVYTDNGNSDYGTLITATISGSTPTFSTPIVYESAGTYNNSVTFDSTENKAVIFYRDTGNSNYGTAVVYQADSTNLNSENYLGISSASYTNGQTATIQIAGSVDDAQSGLTAGQAYYVQRLGGIALTPQTPVVLAGTARSATQLVIGAPSTLAQIIPAGAAGNLLVSNGDSWESSSTPPLGWNLISSVSANNSATIDITSGFNATYNTYAILITNVVPISSSNFEVLTQRSGTFAGAELAFHTYAGTTSVTGSSSAIITINSISSTASNGGGSFIIYINNPTNTTANKAIYGNGCYPDASGTPVTKYSIFGGFQKDTAALTGMRFQFGTGNIASGTFKLYGIKA
jgi:hypothetical protein